MRRLLVTISLLVVACSSGTATAAHPHDATLRLNQVQVLGTHNSYHVQARPQLFSLLHSFDAHLADTLEYSHPPLGEQLDGGARQLELDVFADPAGGLYRRRAGLALAGIDDGSRPPELAAPGFKVLHVQDIDFETRCLTFVECLRDNSAVVGGPPRPHPDRGARRGEGRPDPRSGQGRLRRAQAHHHRRPRRPRR